jgi:hypothetical protein
MGVECMACVEHMSSVCAVMYMVVRRKFRSTAGAAAWGCACVDVHVVGQKLGQF